eukprot:scaffold3984_cov155-Amphora_coffeaeformis.AAC.3
MKRKVGPIHTIEDSKTERPTVSAQRRWSALTSYWSQTWHYHSSGLRGHHSDIYRIFKSMGHVRFSGYGKTSKEVGINASIELEHGGTTMTWDH